MLLFELRELFVLLANNGVQCGYSFAGLQLKHRKVFLLLLESQTKFFQVAVFLLNFLAELICVLSEQINMVAVSKKAFLLLITLLSKQSNLQSQLTNFLFLFFSGSSMASVVLNGAAEKLVGLRK